MPNEMALDSLHLDVPNLAVCCHKVGVWPSDNFAIEEWAPVGINLFIISPPLDIIEVDIDLNDGLFLTCTD